MIYSVPISPEMYLELPDFDIFDRMYFGKRRSGPTEKRMAKLRWAEREGYWWHWSIGLNRNPFPSIDLTPRLTRTIKLGRLARSRAADALDVLRNGLPDQDDDW